MDNQAIERQVRIYLYDLMNTASEHGFKAEDNWEISLVSDTESANIQRQYYPAIITRMIPENILQIFQQVKSRLNQPLNKSEELLDMKGILKEDLRYMVAYNVKRVRH